MLYLVGMVLSTVVLVLVLVGVDLRYVVSAAAGVCFWTACLLFDQWFWADHRRRMSGRG